MKCPNCNDDLKSIIEPSLTGMGKAIAFYCETCGFLTASARPIAAIREIVCAYEWNESHRLKNDGG